MFEVPDAKRVRRDELYSSEGEGDHAAQEPDDADTRVQLKERLARMFSQYPEPGATDTGDDDEDVPDAPVEDEPAFEFRLFSTAGSAPKVVVADENEGDGAILSARPRSFHLKEEFTAEELQQFKEVAVEYEDIVRAAQQRAWGLEVLWKVSKIILASGNTSVTTLHKPTKTDISTEELGKRKRLGKKRRIALRTKERERKQKEEERKAKENEAAAKRLTKEEHLKEKKKRLNREKKLKRRQKEKEKKQAGKSTEDGGGTVPGDAHDSSSSDGEE